MNCIESEGFSLFFKRKKDFKSISIQKWMDCHTIERGFSEKMMDFYREALFLCQKTRMCDIDFMSENE